MYTMLEWTITNRCSSTWNWLTDASNKSFLQSTTTVIPRVSNQCQYGDSLLHWIVLMWRIPSSFLEYQTNVNMVTVYYIGLYSCGEYQVSFRHSKQIIKSIIAQWGRIWPTRKKECASNMKTNRSCLITWVDVDNTLGLTSHAYHLVDYW